MGVIKLSDFMRKNDFLFWWEGKDGFGLISMEEENLMEPSLVFIVCEKEI